MTTLILQWFIDQICQTLAVSVICFRGINVNRCEMFDSGRLAAFKSFLLRVKWRHWTSAPTIASCSAVAVTTASSWWTWGGGATTACASGKTTKFSKVCVTFYSFTSSSTICFSPRADGFKCGSDSTKAVIRWVNWSWSVTDQLTDHFCCWNWISCL